MAGATESDGDCGSGNDMCQWCLSASGLYVLAAVDVDLRAVDI
jgi:hypothetical protein